MDANKTKKIPINITFFFDIIVSFIYICFAGLDSFVKENDQRTAPNLIIHDFKKN